MRKIGCFFPAIFILMIGGCGVYDLITLPSKLFPASETVKVPSKDAFSNYVERLEMDCVESHGEWTEYGCNYPEPPNPMIDSDYGRCMANDDKSPEQCWDWNLNKDKK